jgi:hypothetical protein
MHDGKVLAFPSVLTRIITKARRRNSDLVYDWNSMTIHTCWTSLVVIIALSARVARRVKSLGLAVQESLDYESKLDRSLAPIRRLEGGKKWAAAFLAHRRKAPHE